MMYVFWGMLVIIMSTVIGFAVFLLAINYGTIKVTPEIEEFLNSVLFWNNKK